MILSEFLWLIVLLPAILFVYAYIVYPLLLRFLLLVRGSRPTPQTDPKEWPTVTVLVPVYNEEATIRGKLENLLRVDYPSDRLHLLVASDASTDRTDAIVREFADRGVQLFRVDERKGKTGVQNAAVEHLRGDLVVNSDATVRIAPDGLKALVRPFQDPSVGVASGHNVSVGRAGASVSSGEAAYVTWEMWLRSMETGFSSIVGASGAFYATRRILFDSNFPGALSRDFGTVLIARRRGYRSVSVEEAICRVPSSDRLGVEFRRKSRTMARGLETLFNFVDLLNPFRYGSFAFVLASHKLARWLVYLTWPLALAGLLVLASGAAVARWLLGALAVVGGMGALAAGIGRQRRKEASVLRFVGVFGYVLVSGIAGTVAWWEVFRGTGTAVWEPTRRAIMGDGTAEGET